MIIRKIGFIKEKSGFTLVELLIVIVVLVILTAIAIPSYAVITSRARETAAEAEMKNIAKALEVYSSEKDTYPAEADYPDVLITSGIMQSIPENDPWEISYDYSSISENNYILKCFGINKTDGGGDDIVFVNGVMTEDGAHPNS